MKIPQIIPWLFRITQGIRTGRETVATASYDLLWHPQPPLEMGGGLE